MNDAILGTQIREKRRQIGVTQAALAREIGISASYLNLIERNKRRIAGKLLQRTAEALGLKLEELDGAAERRLQQTLSEVAHLPELENLGLEDTNIGELIGRFPGWARAVDVLARSEQMAQQTARAMADRLTHDPFLGETVHRMLTRISAVRSVSEILTEVPDIDGAERTRFDAIIADESRALTELGEALATYFDTTEQTEHVATPTDEVERFFEDRDNHIAELEATHTPDDIEALVANAPQLVTTAAKARATAALTRYADLARALPMDVFADQAHAAGYDIETLADFCGHSVEQICQRLAALPNRAERPRFGFVRANASGTIIQMLSLEGLAVPRYAAACPLWVLYRAQQIPGQVMRQRALFPNGTRFVFIARARNAGASGFGQPKHYLTDMLVMSEEDAAMTVYVPDRNTPVEEVGPACRLCPRTTCTHRVEDPLGG